MPVYKGDDYLSEAVDSILNQAYSDFEFIIICDDPTDQTRYVLDKYQQRDPRIQLYYQKRQGLVNSLNRGFSIAAGEYIARMDADDISLPNRFEKQIELMDRNTGIGISGTWVKKIGDVPRIWKNPCENEAIKAKVFVSGIWKNPCNHEAIKAKLLFECSMAHPTIMIRRDAFFENNLYYHLDETYAEDYGLWSRAIKVLKFENIPKVLLYYRVHESHTNRNVQKEVINNIRLSQIRQLGIAPSKVESQTHNILGNHEFSKNKYFIYDAKSWLEKLQKTNSKIKIYQEPLFSNILADYWFNTCHNSMHAGLHSWNVFHSFELSKFTSLSITEKIALLTVPNVIYLKNAKHRA